MARRKLPETEMLAATPDVETAPVELPAMDDVPADPPPAPDPVPPPTPAPRQSGFLGPVLGGALAAVAGFGLSHFNVFGLSAPDQSQALAALDQRVTEALANLAPDTGTTEALAARIAALETAPAPEPPDQSRLDGLDQRLQAIEALPATGGDASTAALAAKLAELERRLAAQPAGVDQTEVDAALARLAIAEAEVARRADEAAAVVTAATKAQALDRLREAVAAGGAFEAELQALDDAAVSAALGPHVAGVATLATLQADFPEPARQALQLARGAGEDRGWGARFVDFLAAQTGARSLTPRDGPDPDAILSRADFALGEGRLADALAELGALDPAVRAPFGDWIARAQARLAVDAALGAE